MKAPEKAVILAAGYGTRMLPLSLGTPKPMMPLWGKPVIEHVLNALSEWGVDEALVNLHHQPDSILSHFRLKESNGMLVNFSFEPEIMGTGGALRRAEWFLDNSPFWVINADIAFDLNPRQLLRAFTGKRGIAALWLNEEEGPRTVEMTGGRITEFKSKRPGTEGTYTFCGLQLVSPELLRFIPDHGFSTIIQAYRRAMVAGWDVAGVCPASAFWSDIGTPEAYLKTHRSALERFSAKKPGGRLYDQNLAARAAALRKTGVSVSGFVALGAGVKAHKGARIANSVIWDEAIIADDALVEDAIVGSGAEVHGRVPKIAIRSVFHDAPEAQSSAALLKHALVRLRWSPQATTVIPLEPRGSARVFVRLEYEGQRAILMHYSLEREENALYVRHARFLEGLGWPVPAILLDVPEKQFAVMEDLGDRSLQGMVQDSELSRVMPMYKIVIRAVTRLHKLAAAKARKTRLPMAPPFKAELYRWEREFFANHFLDKRMGLPAGQREHVLMELTAIASFLKRERAVLIHRDLQSSNIFNVKGKPFFIDFQGMRLGAAAYDLASLLCDPYVELPIGIQKQLLAIYNDALPARDRISDHIFWAAAVQRLAQALGAYAMLSAIPGTARFGKHILPGLRMMLLALQQSGLCPKLQGIMRDVLDTETSRRGSSTESTT